jgi:hypothetical protein
MSNPTYPSVTFTTPPRYPNIERVVGRVNTATRNVMLVTVATEAGADVGDTNVYDFPALVLIKMSDIGDAYSNSGAPATAAPAAKGNRKRTDDSPATAVPASTRSEAKQPVPSMELPITSFTIAHPCTELAEKVKALEHGANRPDVRSCTLDAVAVGDVDGDGALDLVTKVMLVSENTRDLYSTVDAGIFCYRGPFEERQDLKTGTSWTTVDSDLPISNKYLRAVAAIDIVEDSSPENGAIVLAAMAYAGDELPGSAFNLTVVMSPTFYHTDDWAHTITRSGGRSASAFVGIQTANISLSANQDLIVYETAEVQGDDVGAGVVSSIVALEDDSSFLDEGESNHWPNPVVGTSFENYMGVGDFNNDGTDDIFVVRTSDETGDVTVVGFLSPHVFDNKDRRPNWLWAAPSNVAAIGMSFCVADVTGDGLNDLAVGIPNVDVGEGRVYIFQGVTNASPLNKPLVEIEGAIGTVGMGSSLAAMDLDGDGILDLVIGSQRVGDDAVAGWMFKGLGSGPSPSTMSSTAVVNGTTTTVRGDPTFSQSSSSVDASHALADIAGEGNGGGSGVTLIIAGCLAAILVISAAVLALFLRHRRTRAHQPKMNDVVTGVSTSGRVTRSQSRSTLRSTRRSRAGTSSGGVHNAVTPKRPSTQYGETSLYKAIPAQSYAETSLYPSPAPTM